MPGTELIPIPLSTAQRQRYTQWYREHASVGHCAVCDLPAPCARWRLGRQWLIAAGLLDQAGRLSEAASQPTEALDTGGADKK